MEELLRINSTGVSQLPLECVDHIVQYVETPGELHGVMRANRVFFSTAARHLWYDPIGTAAKTRNPATSLHRLIRLIFAISPSEDKDVVKVRRLFEWVAGHSKPFRNEWISYHYNYVDVLREPFTCTTPPLLDYLSFIGIFDVFAFKDFHKVLADTICIMPFWKTPYPTGEEARDDGDCDEDDIWQEEPPTVEDLLNTVDLVENSLVTAACGHRLSSLKRISVHYNHLDQYLQRSPSSSSPTLLLSKLASIQEMAWDISAANETSALHTDFDAEVERILALVPHFLEQYRGLHTIEFKLKVATGSLTTMDWHPKELLKALPVLRAPRVIDESNLSRVLARWPDTDLSQVQQLQLMRDYDLLGKIDGVGEWLALLGDGETAYDQQAAEAAAAEYGDKDHPRCLYMLLLHLPSLRQLELATWNDAIFSSVAQAGWIPLRELTVRCSLKQVGQIMNDAAMAFGNTLEKLTILAGNPVIVDEELSCLHSLMMHPKKSRSVIRIGQNWRVPLLSHLVVTAPSLASLEIDPVFLANAVHLTHLELVANNAEKSPPEGWTTRAQLITLNAPFMRYLRLIGEPSYRFDQASLASMAPHLEYLELRDQSGITANGPDHRRWFWESLDFPQLRELRLEGRSVASYPWHKMVDCPKLESVSLGTGGSPDMVIPWMNVDAAAAKGGSSVKHLRLKGMWQLQIPTLESLLRDLCPQLTTLTLRRCRSVQCEDLLSLMTKHRQLLCIDTNWETESISDSLMLDLEQDGGNRGTRESAECRQRIIFSGATHFLSEELQEP
ncbi:hypothetical protein DFQ27_009044 [Actinomortierella ambigua]|uniref:Uncharacterized protein n=1 Tax=Actinomortierella ambigua TaxID=1343610 RepID=A0A9P6TXQ2_9FUNG|nr:hypothetical protein DFQ27_009044 [Actinomortierella ambigua]